MTNKRWAGIRPRDVLDCVYMAAALFWVLAFIFEYLLRLVEFPRGSWSWRDAWYVLAIAVFGLGDGWKHLTAWLGWIIAGWIQFGLLQTAAIQQETLVVYKSVLTFGLLLPMGVILQPKYLRPFLKTLAAAWTFPVALMACVADAAAIQGVNYQLLGSWTPAGKLFWWYSLTVFESSSVSAGFLVLALITALMGIWMFRARWIKILFGVALAPLYLALALTNGRSSLLPFSLAVGVLLAVVLLRKPRVARWSRWPRVGIALGTVFCSFLVLFGAAKFLTESWHSWAPEPTGSVIQLAVSPPLVSAAAAETATQAETSGNFLLNLVTGFLSHSGHNDTFSALSSGRDIIWSAVAETFRARPGLLWQGATVNDHLTEMILVDEVTGVSETFGSLPGHTHSMPVQVLLETGLPGLLLYLGLFALYLRSLIRLLRRGGTPLWALAAALIPLMIYCGELTECLTQLRCGYASCRFLYLFIGLTVGLDKKERIQ